jgi:WD40 repeat protein
MAENLIDTYIFPKEIDFQPGGPPSGFDVDVVNDSSLFAGFQLEVQAAGTTSNRRPDWYQISPEVSSKTPPGDTTRFHVTLLESPVPGFVGLMNITVRVFSLELPDEDREVIRVNVQQGNIPIPLQLSLPIQDFRINPSEQVEIPVKVYNPSQLTTLATVRLQGLNASWLRQGSERHLEIGAGQEGTVTFICQLPDTVQTVSKDYPLTFTATHSQGPPAEAIATLDVSPAGKLLFRATPEERLVPAKWGWLPGWYAPSVQYQLELQNSSNLKQDVRVQWHNSTEFKGIRCQMTPDLLAIAPGEKGAIALDVKARRPLLGLKRLRNLEIGTLLSDQRLGTSTPGRTFIKLRITPMIPLWTFLGAIPLFIYLLWTLSWLNPNNTRYGHQAAVNTVALDGLGNKVISGSTDQDVRLWRVPGFLVPWIRQDMGVLGATTKSVRVVQYRPVENNQVVAGLENGDIQIWDILAVGDRLDSFFYRKDDRVLALQYSQDSRWLYSGHGSGLVLQWDVEHDLAEFARLEPGFREPERSRQFDFAVYGLSFVDRGDQQLAVAGRFNQLVLWDLTTDDLETLPYREGGKDDYILSVDSAELRPHLLATADNQGWITLWDLETCLTSDRPCDIIDQWPDGHDGNAVQSVALSDNACYLVSGGADGRVMLWPLNPNGTRANQYNQGIEIDRSVPTRQGNRFWGEKLYPTVRSVAVQRVQHALLIASGSEDTQVRVSEAEQMPQLGCDLPMHSTGEE